ncbi:hypothetical protein DACRYDRAFT_105697 [Dacryopinax primogenitus]|uniref:JmjC domain-containing protein n=1 Tax=Dacryopinax primogenitus (strain DJM 731) TaxID=1858805 RepID=M5G4C0_DACPD|nr:uncharacterized protein DACRYDRAFT_105697 [Dacryopinax primogenitus]EJU03539.1 hypothetical protein DACRYDRAFT_105697 [Dacryopinax primogenitus]
MSFHSSSNSSSFPQRTHSYDSDSPYDPAKLFCPTWDWEEQDKVACVKLATTGYSMDHSYYPKAPRANQAFDNGRRFDRNDGRRGRGGSPFRHSSDRHPSKAPGAGRWKGPRSYARLPLATMDQLEPAPGEPNIESPCWNCGRFDGHNASLCRFEQDVSYQGQWYVYTAAQQNRVVAYRMHYWHGEPLPENYGDIPTTPPRKQKQIGNCLDLAGVPPQNDDWSKNDTVVKTEKEETNKEEKTVNKDGESENGSSPILLLDPHTIPPTSDAPPLPPTLVLSANDEPSRPPETSPIPHLDPQSKFPISSAPQTCAWSEVELIVEKIDVAETGTAEPGRAFAPLNLVELEEAKSEVALEGSLTIIDSSALLAASVPAVNIAEHHEPHELDARTIDPSYVKADGLQAPDGHPMEPSDVKTEEHETRNDHTTVGPSDGEQPPPLIVSSDVSEPTSTVHVDSETLLAQMNASQPTTLELQPISTFMLSEPPAIGWDSSVQLDAAMIDFFQQTTVQPIAPESSQAQPSVLSTAFEPMTSQSITVNHSAAPTQPIATQPITDQSIIDQLINPIQPITAQAFVAHTFGTPLPVIHQSAPAIHPSPWTSTWEQPQQTTSKAPAKMFCRPTPPETDWNLRHSETPSKRGITMTDSAALNHYKKQVDIMNRLSKPAKEDPRFEERWATEDLANVARKVKDGFVVKIHGGDNWEEKGFNIDTLISGGVLRSRSSAETKHFEFISMDKLHKRSTMQCYDDLGIYESHPFQQFFDEAVTSDVRKNLLDCYYEAYNWPSFLRSLQSKTLRSYNGESPNKDFAMEVSELTEETWFIASHAMSFTGGHHDAGGRYTYIHVVLGEKWWYYFRPNEETLSKMETDPDGVIQDLLSYKYERMRPLGEFYYVPVRPGESLMQPSWTKHFVWTAEDSFMAGKLFDLPSFSRMEKCMVEEHVCGETSTNAVRHGWYSALLNFSVSIPYVKPDRQLMTDDDLRALHRMLLDPRAYVPQDSVLGKRMDLTLSLVVEEVKRIRSKAAGTTTSKGRAQKKRKSTDDTEESHTQKKRKLTDEKAEREPRAVSLKKWRKYIDQKEPENQELHPMHGLRVNLLLKALAAVENLFDERGVEIPKVEMAPYK